MGGFGGRQPMGYICALPVRRPYGRAVSAWAYIRARALPAWAYGRPAPVYLNIRMLKLSRKELMESQVEMERTLLSLFVD